MGDENRNMAIILDVRPQLQGPGGKVGRGALLP